MAKQYFVTNILPKDLKIELQYYTNYPYWFILNKMVREHSLLSSYISHELYELLYQNFGYSLDELNIKYIKILKRNDLILYEIYYYVPNSQLITLDTLVKFVNAIKPKQYNKVQLGDVNRMLKEFDCLAQIVKHSIGIRSGKIREKI